MERLNDILERIPHALTDVSAERAGNLLYLKNQWLNDITFQIRNRLGEECLAWDPALCRSPEEVEDASHLSGGAIMLCGPVGTGKTTSAVHILLSLASERADAIQQGGNDLPDADDFAIVLSAPRLFRKLSQLYGNGGDQADELIERCIRARILLVDDIGTEGGTKEACAAFDDIMDRRYQGRRNRTTIICTNIMPDDWVHYREDMGVFARLADRWRQDDHCIVLKGESLRSESLCDPIWGEKR